MGILTRNVDWPERLAEVVRHAQDQPYVLGEWDCLRFACRCVDAMTGVNMWPRFAGYKTRREALVTIKRIAPTLAEAMSAVLNSRPQPLDSAGRGDVMLYADVTGEEHIGVCLGAYVAVLAPAGLVHLSRSDPGMLASWRIG